MFLALVDEYDELASVLPVEQGSFVIGGQPRDPADRWNRLLRALALRKFAAAKGDHVYAPTVMRSVNALLPEGVPHMLLDDVDELLTRALNGGAAFGTGGGTFVRATDIVLDLLHGVYLHGDYDRWQRAQRWRSSYEEHALWTWTATAEQVVYGLRRDIQKLVDQGVVGSSLKASATPDETSEMT